MPSSVYSIAPVAGRPFQTLSWRRAIGLLAIIAFGLGDAVVARAQAPRDCSGAPCVGQTSGVAWRGSRGSVSDSTARRSGRRWFPQTVLFQPLIADPNQPRNTAGLIFTDLFTHSRTAHPAERPPFILENTSDNTDVQGAVGVGFSHPVFRLAEWPGGGLDIGWMVGLFSRFRMEQSSKDLVSDDWYVGIPFTLERGPLSARVRLLHHSSHMGDEVQQAGARRIEYSWEGADGLLAWSPAAHSRVYGGGTWVIRPNTYLLKFLPSVNDYREVVFTEHAALQAGAETGWYPWAHGNLGLVAGIDWQAGDRADWRSQWSVVAGIAGHGPGFGGRLVARCFRGPSTLGEFFLTDEHYCGLETTLAF
jgi:Protein of unknown function (DUF1207)